MKRLLSLHLSILTLIAMSLAIGGTAVAETKVDVSGQMRYRSEFDRRAFNSDIYKLEKYSLLRTRVKVAAEIDENSHAVIQFQDSRLLGGKTAGGANQSATLADGKNVDVHQAYLKLDNLFGEGWGAMAGRFEINFGNERVFGAVGWDNVGRAWEGASSWYDNSSVKIAAWALKAIEMKSMTGNRDFDVYGYSVDVKKAKASFFGMLERDARRDVAGKRNMSRFNLGGHIKQKKNQLDFEVNAVYQGGTVSTAYASATTKTIVGAAVAQAPTAGEEELDIKAYMVTAEFGYNFPGSNKARVALAVDVTSGDDSSTDTDFKTYNNLYYTGHKFRGYMDYFLKSNSGGLMDLIFRSRFSPTQGWIIKGDVHYFKTMQDYVDFNALPTSDVGIEIDVTVVTTRVKGAKIVSGLSVFLPEDSFAGAIDSDPAVWGYSQVIVNF
jgi:Alginate export